MEATRKAQTDDLMKHGMKWMASHEGSIVRQGLPLGKTKRVTADGVSEYQNDLQLVPDRTSGVS